MGFRSVPIGGSGGGVFAVGREQRRSGAESGSRAGGELKCRRGFLTPVLNGRRSRPAATVFLWRSAFTAAARPNYPPRAPVEADELLDYLEPNDKACESAVEEGTAAAIDSRSDPDGIDSGRLIATDGDAVQPQQLIASLYRNPLRNAIGGRHG